MPRLLNKDTSPFHTPAVTLADGKRAPSIALVPNEPASVSLDHARSLAKHVAVADRIRRGLIVDADEEEARLARREAPAPDLLDAARMRIKELETQLAAATAAPKTSAEAKKKLADLEAQSALDAERIKELEVQLAAATARPKTSAEA